MPIPETPNFQVRETSGRRRTVTLVGRALPYRPFDLEVEQRVKVTNPAGNPQGYGTTMGPIYGSSQLSGFWKDRFVGVGAGGIPPITVTVGRSASATHGAGNASTQVSAAQDAVQLFESICADGNLLEVTWGPIIRRGYLKKFETKTHNIHDIEWTMNFDWTGKELSNDTVEFAPQAGQVDAARGLAGLFRDLLNILDTPGQMVTEAMESYRDTIAHIGDSMISLEEHANGLQSSLDITRDLGNLDSLLGTIAASADSIKNTAEASGWAGLFTDFRGQVPFSAYLYDQASSRAAGVWEAAAQRDLDAVDPELILQAQIYVAETITQARRMRDEACARATVLQYGQDCTIGTYRSREGEDLRDVSERYYGTTSQWRTLMLFNNLQGSELYVGQVLAIPRITAQGGLES